MPNIAKGPRGHAREDRSSVRRHAPADPVHRHVGAGIASDLWNAGKKRAPTHMMRECSIIHIRAIALAIQYQSNLLIEHRLEETLICQKERHISSESLKILVLDLFRFDVFANVITCFNSNYIELIHHSSIGA